MPCPYFPSLSQAFWERDIALGYNSGYTKDMKTAVSIPDHVFHAAETLANRLGISRSELFARALAAYTQAHQHDRVREALDLVYDEEPSRLDAALSQMQRDSVTKDSW